MALYSQPILEKSFYWTETVGSAPGMALGKAVGFWPGRKEELQTAHRAKCALISLLSLKTGGMDAEAQRGLHTTEEYSPHTVWIVPNICG